MPAAEITLAAGLVRRPGAFPFFPSAMLPFPRLIRGLSIWRFTIVDNKGEEDPGGESRSRALRVVRRAPVTTISRDAASKGLL